MPLSREPANGQRLLNVIDIPGNLSIAGVSQPDSDELEIIFLPENHSSRFTTNWPMGENCYCINTAFDDRSASHKILWQGDSFSANLPRSDYSEFTHSRNCKIATLQAFSDYGFAMLTGVPCEPGRVLEVIEHFGFSHNTNYGELFEVRTEINPNNLAYSNRGLACHTDNPYRDPVPTIQLLHCLSSSASGGDSILVDGFRAAEILQQENSEHFATLVENWINFRFSDREAELISRLPMIETNDLGDVIRVRYNNRSIASLRLPEEKIKPFYAAYRHFGAIIERDELKIVFKLQPGHLILFDNTRVMHARTAFATEGKRHLLGAYADLDGLYSTLYVLKRGE
jgi:gamma-butyrobetaine dioxygenase